MSMNLDLTKQEAQVKLDLRKEKLDKLILTKDNFTTKTSRVAVVIDESGSMMGMFSNGTVQDVLERIFPIAQKFDDNGELDVWTFSNGFHRQTPMTVNNFYNYVDSEIKFNGGGTNYAPVLEDILSYYVKEQKPDVPTYVVFITDGDNFDKPKTTEIIKKMSHTPIFVQFVGIGSSNFDYLETLDDMDGRYVDNVDFFSVNNINKISDDDLYAKLMTEYPEYLNYPKVKEMLENPDSISISSTSSTQTTPPKKKGLFGLFGR